MISKISKLKNFGIFYNFTWLNELSTFKKFNLIYGWNRSGKTTISRVFESCEKKCVYDEEKFKQYPKDGEFEIITDDGITVNNTNVDTNILPIKIFNQDFIDQNISFDPSDSCNPIVYVSEEDIVSKKQLQQFRQDKILLQQKYEETKKDKSTKEETKNTFLTGLGREIANVLFDKSYNRTKAEFKINSIGADNFSDKQLSDEDKKKYEKISKSEPGNNIDNFPENNFSFLFGEIVVDNFKTIYSEVNNILNKEVVSETIDRLKNDQDLNTWVKQGFDLHKDKNEDKKCLFCEKPFEGNFLDLLSKHFSKDYEELQNKINFFIAELTKIKKEKIDLENSNLYPDLKDDYTIQAKQLNDCIEKLNNWINKIIGKLEQKYSNPLSNVAVPEMPDDFLNIYNNIIIKINKIISEHNVKIENHTTEVSNAKEKLELHSISVALAEKDYKKMTDNIEEDKNQTKEVLESINKIDLEISELEKKTSNIGPALGKINEHLKGFFGRKEIELELDTDKKGYIIKRNNQLAENLSEGEKTAIAFSYFIVKVDENDFDKNNGIIFIDDPISSFDTNFIYHCFSLISIHFGEVGQLFISTHNFQLFNLVKEWFINKNRSVEGYNKKAQLNGSPEKPMPCEFFMVENFIESDIRKAKISELDYTLKTYKSEYHFLFAKLREFSNKPDIEYEDFYTIGNMARRFFDIFADFKIPTTGHPKSKMEVLIKTINDSEEKISEVDAGKAYKIVNEFSHNSDPTSTIEHKDKTESKEAVKILLNIVKESDPKHFEILESHL